MDRTTAYTDQERSMLIDACMLDASQFLNQDDSGVTLNLTKRSLFGFEML